MLVRMKRKSFTDEIRQAIDESGRTRMAIAEAIGVNRGTISNFMNCKRGLSSEILDRLADELDLHATVSKQKVKST